ncbi:MAG: cbb3-type cytochrome oxidase assembly protein CcoS [Burkholderiales bacterium]|nr:MAG: cbb3-type cytochrome oxidase assembly protein CcoS [Burkholderiales bacterium]
MEALYLLIPLSLAIVVLAAWIFLRMSDSGQFDDMDAPAHSILLDDDRPPPMDITPKGGAVPKDPAPPDNAGR